MQHGFAITATQTDIPQVGVVRDEELKRIENERTAEKKVTFTQNYNKKRGPDHGSEQWTRGQDFLRRNQNYENDGNRKFSPRPSFAYENNLSNNRRSYDQRPNQPFNRHDGNLPRNGSFNNSSENWRNNGKFFPSPLTQRRDFSQKNSNRHPRSDQHNNSAFRRSDNRPTTSFTSYEQKFLQNDNQISSNVVRLTTTDDTINEISDLCPLNY